ncbi:hypothetical protein HGRIS_001049 [Hohenbuehelia grisea]|uniref:Uncharacterized protein n=1 Tax=Hohenbuehelia grisea TaxID=104357 RepID=A0ABR3JQ00_9AGAR
MTDQSALRPDGTLKDASEISWFHDKDDTTPLSDSTSVNALAHEGRGRRHKVTTRLEESLRAEREDEDGQPLPPKSRRKQRPAPQKKQSTKASDSTAPAISSGALLSDAEDDIDLDFVYVDSDDSDPPTLLTCSDSDDSEDDDNNGNDEDFFNISPEEIADILPSKSMPDASVKVNARLRQATVKRKQAKESARNADAAQPANKRTRPSADPDINISASTTAVIKSVIQATSTTSAFMVNGRF